MREMLEKGLNIHFDSLTETGVQRCRVEKLDNRYVIKALNLHNNANPLIHNISLSTATLICFRAYLLSQTDVDYEKNVIPLTEKFKKNPNFKCYSMILDETSVDILRMEGYGVTKEYLLRIRADRMEDGLIRYVELIDSILKKGIDNAVQTDDTKVLQLLRASGANVPNVSTASTASIASTIDKEIYWNMFYCACEGMIKSIDKIVKMSPNIDKYIKLAVLEGGLVSGDSKILNYIKDNIPINDINVTDFEKILNYPFKCYNLYKIIHDNSVVKNKIVNIYLDFGIAVKSLYQLLPNTRHIDLVNAFCTTHKGIEVLAELSKDMSKDLINEIIADPSVPFTEKIFRFPIYRSLNRYTNMFISQTIFTCCEEADIKIIEDDADWEKKAKIFRSELFSDNDIREMVKKNNRIKIHIFDIKKTRLDDDGFEHPIKLETINNVQVMPFRDPHNYSNRTNTHNDTNNLDIINLQATVDGYGEYFSIRFDLGFAYLYNFNHFGYNKDFHIISVSE